MADFLAALLIQLLQAFAGGAVARDAGRQDAAIQADTVTEGILRAQVRIAAAPVLGRDALRDRMRGGGL